LPRERAAFASEWRRRRLTPEQPLLPRGVGTASGRADPVELLTRRDADRVPELVPVRRARIPSRRSPSTAAPPRSWPATSRPRRTRAWPCSSAATPTCRRRRGRPCSRRSTSAGRAVADFSAAYAGPERARPRRLRRGGRVGAAGDRV